MVLIDISCLLSSTSIILPQNSHFKQHEGSLYFDSFFFFFFVKQKYSSTFISFIDDLSFHIGDDNDCDFNDDDAFINSLNAISISSLIAFLYSYNNA